MSKTEYRDEPSTNASILQRARQGDPQSWQTIAHLYGPIIYGWARRAGCQSADAADVMQDTLTAVATAITRFDYERDGATFRGWLWTITRNKIRDHARLVQEEAAGGTAAQQVLYQIADKPDAWQEPPTSAQSDTAETRRRLIELLRQDFDPRSWKMFWETAVMGRQPVDVADEMGVSKWAVYKARARVLQRLQQDLAGLE